MRTSWSIGLAVSCGIALLVPARAVAIQGGLPQAAPPATQRWLDRPARLHVEGKRLVAALEELARTSGVPLAYSPSRLPDPSVTCTCAKLTLAQALAVLLHDTGFTFREAEDQVVIVPQRVERERAPELRLVSSAALGVIRVPADDPLMQPITHVERFVHIRAATITGTVTSEGGGAVASAVVSLRRTQLSTTTDALGRYRIVVPSERIIAGPDTLVVERIGYATNSTPFELRDGDIRLDVVLALRAVPLDQIVVTGTAGRQERRAQPAVVGTIDAAELMRRAPISNVTEMLQARMPGVTVTQSSGMSGAAARINIRGAASISLSNQPLVFLDGVRIDGGTRGLVNVSGSGSVGQAPSALNDINPDDIESIEVVKGPAAATLYGADASAGVIQIITKRGRVGSRTFVQDIAIEYDNIAPNFAVPTNYALCTAGTVAPTSPNPLCRGREVGAIVSDNPAERINAFREGWLASLRYSARGGGENYGYFASFAMANEEGTTRNNELKHRSGRANFTFAPSSRLSFDASFSLSRSEYDLPRSDQDAYGYYIQSAFGSPLTVRDDPTTGLAGGMLFGSASLESLSSITSRVSALRAIPAVQVRYAPVSWFSNRLTLGADLTQGRGFQHFPKNDLGWYPDRLAAGNGDVSASQEDDRSYTVDYLGNIRATFGRDGEFVSNLSFGSQYIHRVLNRLSGTGAGLATNAAYLVTNAATTTVGQAYSESQSQGLFVQEQIGFRDRLFFQAALRADRNSAFGSEVGTFYLPKVGVSYVISEEPFWGGMGSIFPTLRLRAAYGTTGRSPTSGASLQTFATARYVTDAGLLELGVVPGNPGNPDLKPERGKELELGFDAGFLNDRVGAEVTYFDKKSTDLLVAVPVPPSSGFGSSPLGNIGEVQNRGFEFTVRATPISTPNVTWDLGMNGTTLHNEVISLGTVGTFINNFRAFVEGEQIASWWVHRIRSIDETQGRVVVSDTAEFAGNQLPTLQATLTSTLTLLRNLRVYGVLERKSGYHVYNLNQEFRDRSSRNSASAVLPADQGGYPARERLRRLGPYVSERTGLPVGVGNVKEPYLQKGDHVRFQELTATLTLPPSLVSRFGATGASITVGGRNLALWKDEYEGDDPDVLGTGPTATGLNQLFNTDVFTVPPARRWIARMNLQF